MRISDLNNKTDFVALIFRYLSESLKSSVQHQVSWSVKIKQLNLVELES